MKRIYIVRHGETEGNVGRYYQDDKNPLTEKGHVQAETTAQRLASIKLDALVASPYYRAQQTAEHIANVTNLPIETFEAFHECQQPLHIVGKSKDEGEGLEYENSYLQYYVLDEVYAEGFENFNLVMERAEQCAKFLKEHSAQNIVVVSHCAFIHVFSSFLLLQETRNKEVSVQLAGSLKKMSNAGVTEFTYDNGKWELATWNDEAHFAE